MHSVSQLGIAIRHSNSTAQPTLTARRNTGSRRTTLLPRLIRSRNARSYALFAACLTLTLCGCGGKGSGTTVMTGPPVTGLTVLVSGHGSVASTPAGISVACTSACSASDGFPVSSSVTLTETPASGYTFTAWGGACSGSASTCTVSLTQPLTVNATFTGATNPAAKPTIIGLVTMGQENFIANGTLPTNQLLEANAHPGVYSAAVIELTWSQLEPQTGVFDDSALVSALQTVQAYNAQYPTTPLVAKLRIFAGVNAPAWVLTQVGSVSIVDAKTGNTEVLPDFWTPTYTQLWTYLQNHLASEYDTNPLIGEVAISVCSSITAEPFIIPGSPSNIQTLLAAGYSDTAMQTCLSSAPSDYAAWTQTPLDYTFNPFFSTATGQADNTFTLQVVESFRAALGTRAVVANHDFDDPINPPDQTLYTEFQSLYTAAQATTPPTISPLEFQSLGPAIDWSTTVPYAITTYHPTEFEIWNTTAVPQGLANISLTQLQQWAAQIKAAN